MKKILLSTLLLIIGLTTYAAVWQSQGEAEITFCIIKNTGFQNENPVYCCFYNFHYSNPSSFITFSKYCPYWFLSIG